MTYELAKELKDAGFPQYTGVDCRHTPPAIQTAGERVEESVYFPTLSELIEACGNERIEMVRPVLGLWEVRTSEWKTNGSTPEEAVARLWLALNKKV